MPKSDRTGTKGQEANGGRGRGGGRGRDSFVWVGTGGYCICPNCGERVPRLLGIPCFERRCPNCGTFMMPG
jgi:hypothetical protein